MKKTFIIKYSAYSENGGIIKSGKMKVKNRLDSLEAQCTFEKFLEKKYSNFGRLVVYSCEEEDVINSIFGDIFK